MSLGLKEYTEKLLAGKIGESMQRRDFQKFMSISNYGSLFDYATEYTLSKPDIAQKTVRDGFNQVMLWKPHFCGKEHEMPGKYRETDVCPHHNQPMCGHPERGLFYPVLALSGFIAKKIDRQIEHPGEILEGISLIDTCAGGLSSSMQSATSLGIKWSEVGIPDDPQGSVILEEKEFWEQRMKPYLDRVSSIIRGI